MRGRGLVDLLAGELTSRLGAAELLWSRVSREPAATFAAYPGTAPRRPGPETGRPGVARAGAWTDTGWPATMESAVRSGRAAARAPPRLAAGEKRLRETLNRWGTPSHHPLSSVTPKSARVARENVARSVTT